MTELMFLLFMAVSFILLYISGIVLVMVTAYIVIKEVKEYFQNKKES